MLPNLIIIGAMKSGTTALHHYLGLHPQISMSKTKELAFFAGHFDWHRGVDWYASQFPDAVEIRGEASPHYSAYPMIDGVPERMKSVIPDTRIIYLMRDPVQRLLSDYVHRRASGTETRPFSDAVSVVPTNPYVARSLYGMQMQRYANYIPLEKIILLTQEQLLQQRRDTLKRVFGFLGVDRDFDSPHFSKLRHQTKDKRQRNEIGKWLSWLVASSGIARVSADAAWHVDRLLSLPFSSRIERPRIDFELEKELHEIFDEDRRVLDALIGRTASDTQPEGASS